jgi:hypothetical protein
MYSSRFQIIINRISKIDDYTDALLSYETILTQEKLTTKKSTNYKGGKVTITKREVPHEKLVSYILENWYTFPHEGNTVKYAVLKENDKIKELMIDGKDILDNAMSSLCKDEIIIQHDHECLEYNKLFLIKRISNIIKSEKTGVFWFDILKGINRAFPSLPEDIAKKTLCQMCEVGTIKQELNKKYIYNENE